MVNAWPPTMLGTPSVSSIFKSESVAERHTSRCSFGVCSAAVGTVSADPNPITISSALVYLRKLSLPTVSETLPAVFTATDEYPDSSLNNATTSSGACWGASGPDLGASGVEER